MKDTGLGKKRVLLQIKIKRRGEGEKLLSKKK